MEPKPEETIDIAAEKERRVREQLTTDRGGAHFIVEGRKLGIPEEEIKAYALRVIERDTMNLADPSTAFRMAANTKVATQEEVSELVKKTLTARLAKMPFDTDAAEYLYGKDSVEYKTAEEALEREMTKRKDRNWDINRTDRENNDVHVVLPKEATFADVFEAMDKDESEIDESLDGVFYNELLDNFGEDVVMAIADIKDEPETAKNTRVLDFFKQHGYTREDVEVYLPLRFK